MAVIQRPLKGSRISSFYPVKNIPALSSLDSAFQLQEYISLLIRADVHDVETIVSLPGRQTGIEREGSDGAEDKDSERDSKSEVTVDESCWIYEQLRRLAQDLTHPLITTLQHECTRATCPEMKAGEWLYLCVAHGNEGAMEQCCAIDYILHTLDSATALLNSPRAFPSRLSIPPTSTRHFSSLARRLGRIFAHAYYHHREAFEQAEAESSLYARFLALTSKFNLVPSEFLVIPPRLASVDEEHEREELSRHNSHVVESQHQELKPWTSSMSDSSSVINLSMAGSSSPTPEIGRNPSPRRMGRSRTDTMVHSEAANVAEELARADHFSAEDLDRAIAAERMLSADPQGVVHDSVATDPYSASQGGMVSERETYAEQEHEHKSSLDQEPEVLLDISAPAPTEPAIPTDVETEEDITEESISGSTVPPSEPIEPEVENHRDESADTDAVQEEPTEEHGYHGDTTSTNPEGPTELTEERVTEKAESEEKAEEKADEAAAEKSSSEMEHSEEETGLSKELQEGETSATVEPEQSAAAEKSEVVESTHDASLAS